MGKRQRWEVGGFGRTQVACETDHEIGGGEMRVLLGSSQFSYPGFDSRGGLFLAV